MRVVVNMFFVLHLPKHKTSLLLHVGKYGMLDVQVVDGANFIDDLVNFLFDIIVHDIFFLIVKRIFILVNGENIEFITLPIKKPVSDI